MLTGFQNRPPPRRNVDQNPPPCPKVGFSSLGRPAVGGPREGKKAITPHRFGGPAGRTAANSDTERNGDLLLARRLGPPHHIRQGGLHGLRPSDRSGRHPGDPSSREAFHGARQPPGHRDRKSTRLNSSHLVLSYAVFC